MELYTAEAEMIRKQLVEWITHPTYELEATFGPGGEVDATTFIAVAQRLRAKGYTAVPAEDRLAILTPDAYRFTLTGLGLIQKFCRDDVMTGMPFEVIQKDRATPDSQVDLDDYGVRVKTRRETPIPADDPKLKALLMGGGGLQKAFRMIRRWSFVGDGLRFDMSIVRSTRMGPKGEYRWQRRFRDQDIMSAPPTYEIEVELLHKEGDAVGAAVANSATGAAAPSSDPLKRLVKGVGEVLRGIQKHHLLIRRSVAAKVLAGYTELTGTDGFVGPNLRVLLQKNFQKERTPREGNIRDGYNVTDKADGLRALGFCDSRGELFLIDQGMRVYRTGLQRPECRMSLVDGEWVTLDKEKKPIQHYKVFDVIYAPDKKLVAPLPFQSPPEKEKALEGRHGHLKAWVATWNAAEGARVVAAGLTPTTRLLVSAKDYVFAPAGDTGIFRAAQRVLDTVREYYTDGLIFTPNREPLPARPGETFMNQFKWKPARDNTVDFLVITEKVPGKKKEDLVTTAVKPGSGETVTYKTLNLMVGSSDVDPYDVIMNQKPIPRADRGPRRATRGEYRPVRFAPKEFPDSKASICNLPIKEDPDTGEQYVVTEHGGEPIQDMTVVEMAYNPIEAPGWRWIPLRVRMDKTERLQRGILGRTLNSEKVAEETWMSIYDPITETMIRTGNEQPSEGEMAALTAARAGETRSRRYYEKRQEQTEDERLVKEMRDFHNRVIKEQILFRVGLATAPGAAAAAGPKGATAVVGKSLIDMACGRGGDLHKWGRFGANFVLGVDNSAPNIRGKDDSAFKRYMGILADAGVAVAGERGPIAPMVFAVGNSAKNYRTGEAGITEEDSDVLRAVLGSGPARNIPPYVENVVGAALRDGVDCMSCMFALHYFFDSPDSLRGFITNIAENLKVGGMFIGCCFDGESVFELLRGVAKGESRYGMERASQLWKITKQYDEDVLPEGEEGIGLPVDVNFISIGAEHREFLVPYRLLEEKMAEIGCTPLTEEELKAVGLPVSTDLFKAVWEKSSGPQYYPMLPAVQEYSFLNRWFIFKRRTKTAVPAAAAAIVQNAAAANAAAAGDFDVEKLTSAQKTALMEATRRRIGGDARLVGIGGPGLAPFQQLAEREPEMAADVLEEVTGRRPRLPLRPAAEQANAVSAARAEALGAAAAGAAPAMRTIPVAPGSAAPATKFYTEKEIFLFYDGAAIKDSLGIGYKGAARWLAPSAPFEILDPEDSAIKYPSVEHFLAAMRYKLATDKPELAASIFSQTGTIHQEYLRKRLLISQSNGGRELTEDEDFRLLKEETAEVREEGSEKAMRKNKAKYNAANWVAQKDAVLRAALTQRWNRDAQLRKILEAARGAGKTLLYYQPGTSTSNLGGVRRNTGVIEGSNKVGQIYMELAGFPGYA